jgi:hypothetical protein
MGAADMRGARPTVRLPGVLRSRREMWVAAADAMAVTRWFGGRIGTEVERIPFTPTPLFATSRKTGT